MDEELKKAFHDVNTRLDSVDGVFDDFQKLLSNHMHDYSLKFGLLKVAVESAIEVMKAETKVIDAKVEVGNAKLESYKWTVRALATFAGLSLGGFITLAIMLLGKLIN